MENTKDQQVAETQNEQVAQTTESEETVDYEALYKAEVANAIKLRKRSQDAESKLTSYEAKQTEIEEAKLKEAGEFKTLLEKRDSEIKDLKVKATAYDEMLASERSTILDKMTEEDKEQFGDLPLKQLKAIDKKLNSSAPAKQQSEILSNAISANRDLPKDWTTMDEDDRRKYWTQIVASAKNRN
tara:strand:- start:408 stop:962 length:555 start_codon:yes stop_codon:yes gene_type:complete